MSGSTLARLRNRAKTAPNDRVEVYPGDVIEELDAQLATYRAACTSVEFTGDPTGAVAQLIKALQPLAAIAELREIMPEFRWDEVLQDVHIRAACAALNRVRLAMDIERGETK